MTVLALQAMQLVIITTIAGTGDSNFSGDGGPALKAGFNSPNGLTFDLDGNLIFKWRHFRRVPPSRSECQNAWALATTSFFAPCVRCQ